MNLKKWFGKLFIYKYNGSENNALYIVAVLGIIWGILSLSLNFDFPIHLSPEFRSHKSIAMWTFLPTKISAYGIALFFDLFQFIFWHTPEWVNNAIVIVMFALLSPILGGKILTAFSKMLKFIFNKFH